jgi:RNA recognition motif-containing protein
MNIFIGNLPYKIEESELLELFEDYGQVTSLRIITDKETGRSKGFGFAVMPENESALKAIEDLNAAEIYGRNIVVKEADPKPEQSRKPAYGSGGYKGKPGGGGGYKSYGNKPQQSGGYRKSAPGGSEE